MDAVGYEQMLPFGTEYQYVLENDELGMTPLQVLKRQFSSADSEWHSFKYMEYGIALSLASSTKGTSFKKLISTRHKIWRL